jgi:hypothetical protein
MHPTNFKNCMTKIESLYKIHVLTKNAAQLRQGLKKIILGPLHKMVEDPCAKRIRYKYIR